MPDLPVTFVGRFARQLLPTWLSPKLKLHAKSVGLLGENGNEVAGIQEEYIRINRLNTGRQCS